jgi:hypothetical protein
MERTNYIVNTWMLAVLIHSALFTVGFFILEGELSILLLLYTLPMGLLFSIPAFLLSLLIYTPLKNAGIGSRIKFIIWILLSLSTIPFGFYLFCALFFGSELFSDLIIVILPGCVLALLSILIRNKQSFQLLKPQNTFYETNMV